MIAEVALAPAGEQFLELYNPTSKAINLGQHWLKGAAGRWELPQNLVLRPRETLVIARNKDAFRARHGVDLHLELNALNLDERSDVLTLESVSGRVDQVAWGGARGGWNLPGRGALCRPDPARDTNTALDWMAGLRLSPGRPGC